MAHPLIEINRQSWLDILNIMKDTLPVVASRIEGHVYSIGTIDGFLKDYSETINYNMQDILSGCAGEIARYLNSYRVEPRDYVDEFKGIYFLGVAITAQLNRSGHAELRRIHQFTTLHLLNSRQIGRASCRERV